MIKQVGTFLSLTDQGVQPKPVWEATSPSGEKVEFKSYSAATFWLKMITDRVEGKWYRLNGYHKSAAAILAADPTY